MSTTEHAQLAPGTREPLSAIDVLGMVCELFAFFTFAFWGFAGWVFPWNIAWGVATPIIAILAWALFVSPRAMLGVHPYLRAVIELLLYVGTTAAWWSMGQTWVGLGFAIVAVASGLVAGRRRLA